MNFIANLTIHVDTVLSSDNFLTF